MIHFNQIHLFFDESSPLIYLFAVCLDFDPHSFAITLTIFILIFEVHFSE